MVKFDDNSNGPLGELLSPRSSANNYVLEAGDTFNLTQKSKTNYS